MLLIQKIIQLKIYAAETKIFRTVAFKVLNGKLNEHEFDVQAAVNTSKNANKALKMLSDFSKAGGGPKAIHRHTVLNKKVLVRDRLKLLFDPESTFLEIGLLAGMSMDYGNIPAAGSVTGIGKIHGHFCLVGASDATVKGGTYFPITIVKQIRFQELSYLNKLPCIYLVDSGGAFLPLQAEIFPDRDHGGRAFYNEALLSSKGIPQIALVCGSSTAGGAYCPTMAEEAIIVKNIGVIFLGGPPLVKAATGEIVTEQELGGADMHCSISGCTDYYAENEEEAFEMCRESVITLNLPQHPIANSFKEPLYPAEDLNILSGKEFLSKADMYLILSRVLDGSMLKEFKAKYGAHLITGFGFLHGQMVGIIANCGSLTSEDALKGAHFIHLCDNRQIPLIFLQNSSREVPNNANLQGVILKDRSKMVAAHSCAQVPKIAMCVGGCFADDNFTMCGAAFKPNFYFTWPLAHISSSEICKSAMDDELKLLDKLQGDMKLYERLFENTSSAFYAASRMVSDGIIIPSDTRRVLALCLEMSLTQSSRSYLDQKRSLSILRM